VDGIPGEVFNMVSKDLLRVLSGFSQHISALFLSEVTVAR
jgi:hypothetical protein